MATHCNSFIMKIDTITAIQITIIWAIAIPILILIILAIIRKINAPIIYT